MRKAFGVIAGVFVITIALLVLAGGFLFLTSPGRNILATQIENQLAAALDSDAEIGAFEGAPPGHIVLADVTLSSDDDPWLTVERAELRWRPLSLLTGRINIDDVTIAGARLLGRPPEGQETNESSPPSFKLPENLPDVTVRAISIDDFRSFLGDREARLDGAGRLDMGGRRIDGYFTLASDNNLDQVNAKIVIDPETDRLFLDVAVSAEVEGAITTFAELDAPIYVAATADGTISEADITLNGSLADYGVLNGAVIGDIGSESGARVEATFSPGAALAGVAEELGDHVAVEATVSLRPRDGAIVIQEFDSAAGRISGVINWRSDRRGVEAITSKLSINVNDAYRPEITAVTGGTISLSAEINRMRDAYGVKASAESEYITLTLNDASSDLSKSLSGKLAAALKPNQNAPDQLRNGLRLESAIDLDLGDEAVARSAILTLGENAQIAGDIQYSFVDGTISTVSDIRLTPELVSAIAPSITLGAPITGELTISGTPDAFTLGAAIETPALKVNDEPAPALLIRADLAGLPNLPTGDITATSRDGGAGAFLARLRASESGRIAVPALSYESQLFKLVGVGAFDPAKNRADFDVTYQGAESATPWPGLPVEGDGATAGVIALSNASTKATLNARALRVGGVAINGLSASANGPADAITVTAAVDDIAFGNNRSLSDMETRAVVNATDGLEVTVNSFSGLIQSIRAVLKAPTTISLEDGASIDDLRLQWGDDGEINFDGVFSPSLWRANATLANVAIPETDGLLNLQLSLDTNTERPASGEFELFAAPTDEDAKRIHGALLWNGQTLSIASARDAEILKMDIRLPLRLIRAESLGLDTAGEMNGALEFNGDISLIAPYFPTAVQSLEGGLVANIDLAGALAEPLITGAATFTDGAFTEAQTGFSISGLNANANASIASGDTVISFAGGSDSPTDDNEKAIAIGGEITLGETSNIDLVISLDNAEFSQSPVKLVRANGHINIKGPMEKIRATGEIDISELRAEIIQPPDTGLVPVTVEQETDAAILDSRPSFALDYDISITANNRIFVEGRGLESEWRADVDVKSQREAPLVVGNLGLRRGWLDFSGRRFNFTKGEITFDRLSANNPILDVEAEYETEDDVTAIITISGRALEPKIALTSTPARPASDVMALVLFGKPAEDLTAVESLQAANALAQLGGVGIFGGGGGLVGRLRDTVGLDMLNFDVDPEKGGGSLTVGKYVSDGIFVSATQDADGQNGSVRIEYEITDNISVESEIEQNGDQTVSANWKKDF